MHTVMHFEWLQRFVIWLTGVLQLTAGRLHASATQLSSAPPGTEPSIVAIKPESGALPCPFTEENRAAAHRPSKAANDCLATSLPACVSESGTHPAGIPAYEAGIDKDGELGASSGRGCTPPSRAGGPAASTAHAAPPGLCAAAVMRVAEFTRLQGTVYVDHAGSTLYSERQLLESHQEMAAVVMGNPHSGGGGPGSYAAAAAAARVATLALCNAPAADYVCIFTSGATGGLKLVGEAFPWRPGSCFAYTRDNHNSVLGIREQAMAAGACAQAVDPVPCEEGVLLQQASPVMRRHTAVSQSAANACPHKNSSNGTFCDSADSCTFDEASTADSAMQSPRPWNLFAFPAESNFSGARYDLALGQAAASLKLPPNAQLSGPPGRWAVLLDAAKACGSCPPDIAANPHIDFVVLSYYKIFGYPTGLGALLVRRSALPLLAGRSYFSGGTVDMSCAEDNMFKRRAGPAGHEDGTPHFLGMSPLRHGFAALERAGGLSTIERHTAAITRFAAAQLVLLQHSNGAPVCRLYGAHPGCTGGGGVAAGVVGQGAVLAFNVLRADSSYVGYREVEQLAALSGIRLRTGCFCNPGACAAALGLSPEAMAAAFEGGHVCWDDTDLIDGVPTGAVRISFGYMSSFEDAAAVVQLLRDFFVDGSLAGGPREQGMADSIPASHDHGQAGLVIPLRFAACGCQLPAGSPLHAATAAEGSAASEVAMNVSVNHGSFVLPGPDQLRWPKSDQHSYQPPIDLVGGRPSSEARSLKGSESQPMHAPVRGVAVPAVAAAEAASVSAPSELLQQGWEAEAQIQGIWLYPVKSCAGQGVARWPLGPNGLLYDREWALVDPEGRALSQHLHPRLVQLTPTVDLDAGVLRVEASSMACPLIIFLNSAASQQDTASQGGKASSHFHICGESVLGRVAEAGAGGEEAMLWLTAAVGSPCQLVRQQPGSRTAVLQRKGAAATQPTPTGRVAGADAEQSHPANGRRTVTNIGYANEAQFLLVNAASVADVACRVAAKQRAATGPATAALPPASLAAEAATVGVKGAPEGSAVANGLVAPDTSAASAAEVARFRPNILIGGGGAGCGLAPFAEDGWRGVQLGPLQFSIDGPCARCEMVCTDQGNGKRDSPEPLLTLAAFRRRKGRIHFGVLLSRPAVPQHNLAAGVELAQSSDVNTASKDVVYLSVGMSVVGC